MTACYSRKLQRIIMIANTQTSPLTISVGGFDQRIKLPVIMLGMPRILFQCDSITFVTLETFDKMLPLSMVLAGLYLGSLAPCLSRPLLRGMLFLSPATSIFSGFPIVISAPQAHLDRGWVESIFTTLSSLNRIMIRHYRSILRIGL